jgi:hypothetical protein
MPNLAAYVGTGALLSLSSFAQAGTIIGIDNPHRVPGEFIVKLRAGCLASLNNPTLKDGQHSIDSPEWQVARAAVDAEIARMVDKLIKAHPHVRITRSSTPEVDQTLHMKASDKDARAVADGADVESVESLDGDTVIKNITQTTGR